MQFTDFDRQLSEGIAPVYWLKGDDYWCTAAYHRLESLADPNEVSVYTPLDSVDDAMWALNSFPMFGQRRVVVLRDFASFAEEDKRTLTAYCSAPAETSVLVFYRSAWAPKGVVECSFDKLRTDAMAGYLAEYCEKAGIAAQKDALRLLADYCSEDTAKALAEISKLHAYCMDAPIDEAAVKAVVTPDQNYQIYNFVDKVAQGNYVGAHRVLDNLSNGNDQAAFLGLIINHYRRALYGRISGLPPAELGKLLGNTKPYVITKSVDSVRGYSVRALLALIKTLYRLEYDFKSGRMGAAEALDLAIAEAIERRNS